MENFEPRLGDEIPEEILKQSLKEINSKYRSIKLDEFRGNKDVEIHIYQPTSKEGAIASDAYTHKYNKLMRDPDLLTKKQMLKIMEERGIWGKEQEDKYTNLQDDMQEIRLATQKLRANAERRKVPEDDPRVKKDLDNLRKQFEGKHREGIAMLEDKASYLSRTIEASAEEEEIKTKLSLCVKFPDGTLVWPTIEDLEAETDRLAIIKITQESMFFWNGLTQEIIERLSAGMI